MVTAAAGFPTARIGFGDVKSGSTTCFHDNEDLIDELSVSRSLSRTPFVARTEADPFKRLEGTADFGLGPSGGGSLAISGEFFSALR